MLHKPEVQQQQRRTRTWRNKVLTWLGPPHSEAQPLPARRNHLPKQVPWCKQGDALAGLVLVLLHPPQHAGAVCRERRARVHAPVLDALACGQYARAGGGQRGVQHMGEAAKMRLLGARRQGSRGIKRTRLHAVLGRGVLPHKVEEGPAGVGAAAEGFPDKRYSCKGGLRAATPVPRLPSR